MYTFSILFFCPFAEQWFWQSEQKSTTRCVHLSASFLNTSISYSVIKPFGTVGLNHVTAIDVEDVFDAVRLVTMEDAVENTSKLFFNIKY